MTAFYLIWDGINKVELLLIFGLLSSLIMYPVLLTLYLHTSINDLPERRLHQVIIKECLFMMAGSVLRLIKGKPYTWLSIYGIAVAFAFGLESYVVALTLVMKLMQLSVIAAVGDLLIETPLFVSVQNSDRYSPL